MNYVCDVCTYETNDKCNFNKHVTTKRHKKLVDVNNTSLTDNSQNIKTIELNCTCEYCNKKYSNINNLKKHIKTCSKKRIIEKQHQIELQHLKELHNKDILHLTEMIKQKDEIINVLNAKINTECLVLKRRQNDEDFVENLLIEHKNNSLHIYLGNHIIKKEDTCTQLTSFIGEILTNKLDLDTLNHTISSVITYVEKLVKTYIDNFDIMTKLYIPAEAKKKMLKINYASRILQNIEDKVLYNDISKYIASHFL